MEACSSGRGQIGLAFARLGPPNPGLDIYLFKERQNIAFELVFKDPVRLEQLTNLDAKVVRRSVICNHQQVFQGFFQKYFV